MRQGTRDLRPGPGVPILGGPRSSGSQPGYQLSSPGKKTGLRCGTWSEHRQMPGVCPAPPDWQGPSGSLPRLLSGDLAGRYLLLPWHTLEGCCLAISKEECRAVQQVRRVRVSTEGSPRDSEIKATPQHTPPPCGSGNWWAAGPENQGGPSNGDRGLSKGQRLAWTSEPSPHTPGPACPCLSPYLPFPCSGQLAVMWVVLQAEEKQGCGPGRGSEAVAGHSSRVNTTGGWVSRTGTQGGPSPSSHLPRTQA